MPRKTPIPAVSVTPDALALSPAQIERFWSGVSAGEGCWVYNTSRALPNGYVTFSARLPGDRRMTFYVHRLAWSLTHGRNPTAGKEIDHLCNVRNCVKPSHLEEVDRIENVRRKYERNPLLPDPPAAARNRAKTHCPRGHEFTPENTALVPYVKKTTDETGWYRSCRECRRIASARLRASRREVGR